mgnify:CR=1 FL=1
MLLRNSLALRCLTLMACIAVGLLELLALQRVRFWRSLGGVR